MTATTIITETKVFWDKAAGRLYVYNSDSNSWELFSIAADLVTTEEFTAALALKLDLVGGVLSGSLQLPNIGIGATPDATNKLSVVSNAILFADLATDSGGSGDVRTILSKQAVGNTASFLFQDAFSGRAEIGLTGDDSFHFKVSPDGSTWKDALVIDKTTGVVTVGFGIAGLAAIATSGSGADLTAASVTYAKLQNEADGTLLGRSAGSAGAPMEIALDTSAFTLASGTLSLYKAPQITSMSNTVGTVELGQTVTAVTLNWSYNKTMTTASLSGGIGSISPALLTKALTGLSLTTTTTYTLTAGDGVNTTTNSTSVQFLRKRYWGPSANTSLTSAQIIALTGSEFSSARAKASVSYDCTGGAYPYYAYPSSLGNLTGVKVGGLSFSDYTLTTQSFTNASGHTENYIVFKFNNIQSGSGIVVDFT